MLKTGDELMEAKAAEHPPRPEETIEVRAALSLASGRELMTTMASFDYG